MVGLTLYSAGEHPNQGNEQLPRRALDPEEDMQQQYTRRCNCPQQGLGTLPTWSPLAVIGVAFLGVMAVGWLASK
jgi:hypothetical protein